MTYNNNNINNNNKVKKKKKNIKKFYDKTLNIK